MRCSIRRLDRRAATGRVLVVSLITLAVAAACSQDASFPTAPRTAAPMRPNAAVGAMNVIVLPSLGGGQTSAEDLNDGGQVVGSSVTALPGGPSHAFLWTSSGGMQDLGTLGGTHSLAFAINELSQVVGSSTLAGDGVEHAFLWTPTGGMRDLGTLGGPLSRATGINDVGVVVGWSDTPGDVARHAFMWTPTGGMQDLGTLGGASSRAAGINNAGQVVGGAQTSSGHERAFLWTVSGGMQDLGHLGGFFSRATAINDAGQVVGFSSGPGTMSAFSHAFLWTPATGMQDLGAFPGGSVSEARDLSDAGQVVGTGDGFLPPHAFVWTATDGMIDLFPSTQMGIFTAINNHGQAVGGNRVATLQFAEPNRAPVANAGGPYVGHKKKPVAFDGTRSTDPDGDALTYAWDFGDGSAPASGASPVHEYNAWGAYPVTLTVSDPDGLSAITTTLVTIAPPGQLRAHP